MDERKGRLLELRDPRLFPFALGGFTDAEGHVGLRKSGDLCRAEYMLSNRKRRILAEMQRAINDYGIPTSLRGRIASSDVQWELRVSGKSALRLTNLIQIRHQEKLAAREIANLGDGKPWSEFGPLYRSLRKSILDGRDRCVQTARRSYLYRDTRAIMKKSRLDDLAREAGLKQYEGQTVHEIGNAIGVSERTAYRYLRRFHEINATPTQREEE
ncbi:MAG: hypothetical protein OK438_03865 [Thaumarchaeota archaeon]|nr:hypothetical protein [Nitrososphaerota archaeon]